MNEIPAGSLAYHILRVALEKFKKRPVELNPVELTHAKNQAHLALELENRVLASPEARHLELAPTELKLALSQVIARYSNVADYQDDLNANGLEESDLHNALYRERLFDRILRHVGANLPPISDVAISECYQQHPTQFQQPEIRIARHILLTLNPDYPENTRVAIQARMRHIKSLLKGVGEQFGTLAQRYSECPTALNEGRLGRIIPGQLYPALDAVLFNLAAGQLSDEVETPLGLHLLWCEHIEPAYKLPLEKVRTQIQQQLTARRLRAAQKAWMNQLPGTK